MVHIGTSSCRHYLLHSHYYLPILNNRIYTRKFSFLYTSRKIPTMNRRVSNLCFREPTTPVVGAPLMPPPPPQGFRDALFSPAKAKMGRDASLPLKPYRIESDFVLLFIQLRRDANKQTFSLSRRYCELIRQKLPQILSCMHRNASFRNHFTLLCFLNIRKSVNSFPLSSFLRLYFTEKEGKLFDKR